jgi:carboxylate-amine ligase
MPSAEECWRCLETILPWLPVVLAMSANSPWFAGELNGMASNRAPILAELPRAGAPPAFASYREWEAWVERLVSLGVMADYTRLWWDARPHPRFGTLEIRIADQPTSLARTELLVRVIRDLVADVPPRVTPRGDYLQNRWAAARFGTDAQLIHPDGTRLVGVAELLGFEPPAPEATLRRSTPQLVDETLRF